MKVLLLTVFGLDLALGGDCVLDISLNDDVSRHSFGFEKPGECRFVTHPNTSVVNTHFVNGAYLFFVENNHKDNEGCFSEYTAFGVNRSGDLRTTNLIQKSGSCFQGREEKDFQIFSSEMQ